MKKCKNCCLEYDSENQFCNKCGLQLTNETIEKPHQNTQNNLVNEALTEFLKNTGFIIFYLDDIYMQLYNDIGDNKIIIESVSEHYSPKAADKTKLFKSLGFELNEAKTYSKLHYKSSSSAVELTSILENDFLCLFRISLYDCSIESDISKINNLILNNQKREEQHTEKKQQKNNTSHKNYGWIIMAGLIILALWLFQNKTEDGSQNIYQINQNTLGAYSEDDLEKLREYAYDNDQEALKKLILKGKIIEIKSGSEVYLIQTNLTTSEIRIKGHDVHIWIPSKAISTNE